MRLTKKDIVAAHNHFAETGQRDYLLRSVQHYAHERFYHEVETHHEFKNLGTAETSDDWAQEVCINVWKALTGAGGTKKFIGDGEAFFAWLTEVIEHRLNNRRSGVFKYMRDQLHEKVSLTTEKKDEDGGTYEEDNPELHGVDRGDALQVSIPLTITGRDRMICLFILSGKGYEEIGEIMGLTVAAIKSRLQRVQAQMKKEGRTVTPNGRVVIA